MAFCDRFNRTSPVYLPTSPEIASERGGGWGWGGERVCVRGGDEKGREGLREKRTVFVFPSLSCFFIFVGYFHYFSPLALLIL
jgi:hypothetical protein